MKPQPTKPLAQILVFSKFLVTCDVLALIPRNMSYNNRLRELKLWSLEDRRKRADLIEVYKMTRGLSTVEFSQFSCWIYILVHLVTVEN